MAFEFKLPDLGEGLTEGEIVKWLVKAGDSDRGGAGLRPGGDGQGGDRNPLPRKGGGAQIGRGRGRYGPGGVGDHRDRRDREKKSPKPTRPNPSSQEKAASIGGGRRGAGRSSRGGRGRKRPREASPAKPIPAPPRKEAEILAVPMVRKLASDLGVDLRTVKGTGPQGRITKEDVQKAAKGEEAARERSSRENAAKSRPQIRCLRIRRKDSASGDAQDHRPGHGEIEIHDSPCRRHR